MMLGDKLPRFRSDLKVAPKTDSKGLFEVTDPVLGRITVMQPVTVDERPLIEIARVTGGRFFRAGDSSSLSSIYAEIDRMERAPIRALVYREYRELGPILLALAAMFLVLHGWSNATWAFRVP